MSIYLLIVNMLSFAFQFGFCLPFTPLNALNPVADVNYLVWNHIQHQDGEHGTEWRSFLSCAVFTYVILFVFGQKGSSTTQRKHVCVLVKHVMVFSMKCVDNKKNKDRKIGNRENLPVLSGVCGAREKSTNIRMSNLEYLFHIFKHQNIFAIKIFKKKICTIILVHNPVSPDWEFSWQTTAGLHHCSMLRLQRRLGPDPYAHCHPWHKIKNAHNIAHQESLVTSCQPSQLQW